MNVSAILHKESPELRSIESVQAFGSGVEGPQFLVELPEILCSIKALICTTRRQKGPYNAMSSLSYRLLSPAIFVA